MPKISLVNFICFTILFSIIESVIFPSSNLYKAGFTKKIFFVYLIDQSLIIKYAVEKLINLLVDD